ncbi:aldehyde dehydrogenase family protein [bacterium]|nr:aldehyde dehydrogenase family protein [bacterium]
MIKSYFLQIPNWKSKGEFKDLNSPFSGETIAKIQQATDEDIEKGLEVVHGAFQKITSKMPAVRRSEILKKASQIIKNREEELALCIACEGGKPYKDALVEVRRASTTVELAGEEALNLCGEQIPMDRNEATANKLSFVIREPIGVVLVISAFNHPLNLIAHQVSPAIACGCSVIIKPASTTPVSAIKFVEILREAGLPESCAFVTPVSGSKAEKLVRDKRIAFLTFIGGAEVGWELRRKIANGTRMSAEHGGNAATIVCEDADLSLAVPSITKGGFYHSGQVCISTQRIYVHKKIYNKFLEGLKKSVSNLVVGDPTNPKTDCGPIITKEELERVKTWINEAVSEGAKIELGGKRLSFSIFEPTILTNVTEKMKVMACEVFGPVVCVVPYEDFSKVLEKVNATENPFQSSIFTRDLNKAIKAAKAISASTYVINDSTAFRVDWMPFGGRGNAGLGMGGIKYACEEMTMTKQIIINAVQV